VALHGRAWQRVGLAGLAGWSRVAPRPLTASQLQTGKLHTVTVAAAGIPIVMFGPGGQGAHAAEEWVSLSGTEAATRTLVAVANPPTPFVLGGGVGGVVLPAAPDHAGPGAARSVPIPPLTWAFRWSGPDYCRTMKA
jgi:hypothetical protein